MKTSGLIILLLIMFFAPVFPQEESMTEAEIMEEILVLSDENDAGAITENLAALSDNPVLLNSGKEEEIARLFFLSEFQVKVLADHVANHGMILSVYEIALLPGFDRSTAMLLTPYVSFDVPEKGDFRRGGSNSATTTVMLKLCKEEEEETRVRSIFRFRHESHFFSYGVTAENDPGESFTFKGASGPDFLSGHLMYQGTGIISRVIVGDYSLRFGEGVTLNNNTWMGSRLASPSFMTGRSIVSPYVSTDENNFFRGLVCVFGKVTGGAVVFFSSNAIDARLAYEQSDDTRCITNLVKGGLHDSEAGLAARNSLTEILTGFHLSAGTALVRAGVTASFTNFSLPFHPDTMSVESLMDFRGDHLVNLGADFKAGTGSFLFFSEVACSYPGSWAALAGIRASPATRVTVSLLARHYSYNYYSFHARAFASSASVMNEDGMACNIHVEVARHLFMSAGADICYYPWPRYRSVSPSTGSRLAFRCEYTPGDDLSLLLTWTNLIREYDMHDDTGVPSSSGQKKNLLTARFAFAPTTNIDFITRIFYSWLPESKEKGYMLCQDMALSAGTIPVRLWMRYSLFSTGGYDSRFYAWENDMLQSFNVPALYNDGSRSYVMIDWKPLRGLELRAKYGVTLWGTDLSGETDREVRVQAKVTFSGNRKY